MKTFKTVAVWIFAALAVIAVIFGLSFFGLEMKRYFAPRHAEINRQVFENTSSFIHGKAQHLTRLKFSYEQADTDASRAGLKTVILHEASTVDWDLLPINLRSFLYEL